MSSNELKTYMAPFGLIPITEQSTDVGLCVDGICAVPQPASREPEGATPGKMTEANGVALPSEPQR